MIVVDATAAPTPVLPEYDNDGVLVVEADWFGKQVVAIEDWWSIPPVPPIYLTGDGGGPETDEWDEEYDGGGPDTDEFDNVYDGGGP